MFDPLVITLSGVHVRSWPIHADAPHHQPRPLSEALTTKWSDDRYFVPYQVAGVLTWPRLAKKGLAPDEDLSFSVTPIDIDIKRDGKKAPLDEAEWKNIRSILAGSQFEPWDLYPTTHGVRLVFLHDPWGALEEEAVRRALGREFATLGLTIDPKCIHWDCLFRLPHVVRDDGKPSPPFPSVRGPIVDLSAAALPRDVSEDELSSHISLASRPQPAIVQAEELAWKNRKPTQWATAALKVLPSDILLAPLKTHAHVPLPPADRTGSLLRMVGSLVSRLIPDPTAPNKTVPAETTPEHIFGLIVPTITLSDPHRASGGRDLYTEGFRQICNMWARDEAKQALAIANRAKAHQVVVATTEQIAKVMAGYPNPIKIPPEDVHKFALVSVGNSLYTLQRDGYYSSKDIQKAYAFASLRDAALPFVDLQDDDGDVTAQALLNRYHTPLRAVRYKAGPGSVQGWTDGDTMYVSPYHRRTDIPWEFQPEIDEFFRVFAQDKFALFEQWIAFALAYDRAPLPGLFLISETDSGKSLMVRGLRDTTNMRDMANAQVFDPQFNYGWNTAFMANVDEGWPPGASAKGIPESYRRQVTGEAIAKINTKGRHPAACEVYPRFLFTTNNERVFDPLLGDTALEREDLQAIEKRILCMDLRGNTEAAKFLKKIGRAKTTEWIEQEKIAKHALFLYKTKGRDTELKGRFLMEGYIDPEILGRVGFRSGHVPEIGKALCEIACKLPRAGDNGALVRAKDIMDHWDDLAKNGRRSPALNSAQIGQALTRFIHRDRGRNGHHDGRWYVNMDAVKQFNISEGIGANLDSIKSVERV